MLAALPVTETASARKARLLLESSQDRTSSVSASLNNRRRQSTALAVSGELMATVLPSFLASMPPNAQNIG